MAGALDLSSNRFTELNSFCNLTTFASLKFLDVSSHQLLGELTDCWSNFENLEVLILANNKLKGKIPISIGSLTQVWSLHLSNNNLRAELPSSFKSLKSLQVFNVGENNLSGPIPVWMGNELKHLVVLSLRSNNFYGSIPSQLCHLQDLKVLDLSSNNLSSSIPTCLGNITAMKGIESRDTDIGRRMWLGNKNLSRDVYNRKAPGTSKSYNDKLPLIWKGSEEEFRNLWILKSIDLSSSKLVGEIPREITELIKLISLNLSRNNLSGQIPKEIGQLKSMDSLDLSRNHFSGQIPPSLSQIDRLSTLDLSSNNLSGKIPRGTQLQTRDAAAFMDNPELCGEPLPKNCTYEEEPSPHGTTKDGHGNQDQDDFITKGFYISIAIGFIVGFWQGLWLSNLQQSLEI